MEETAEKRTRRQFREMEERVAAQRDQLAELKRGEGDLVAIVSTSELIEGMEYVLSRLRQSTAADVSDSENRPLESNRR